MSIESILGSGLVGTGPSRSCSVILGSPTGLTPVIFVTKETSPSIEGSESLYLAISLELCNKRILGTPTNPKRMLILVKKRVERRTNGVNT